MGCLIEDREVPLYRVDGSSGAASSDMVEVWPQGSYGQGDDDVLFRMSGRSSRA